MQMYNKIPDSPNYYNKLFIFEENIYFYNFYYILQ